MVASFFKKRKRVTFEGEEEEARAAGGDRGALPPLDAACRDRLATLGAGFRKVNEEQLARALRGELAQEDVVRPPVQQLQQEDEGRLKLKDGELTMVAKKKKCKDFAEWEKGFLRILCDAPAEARDDLMDFVEWARTIAAEFSFYHFNEFYEHLVRQVQWLATGISLDGYDRVWQVYKQTAGLKKKAAKKHKDHYTRQRDAAEQQRPAAPEDAGGGRGKGGKGARGRGGGCGGRGGRGGRGGADGVRTVPDPTVGSDAELEFGQPIAVENIGAVDAHVGCGPPDVEDGDGVPLVSPGGADTSGRWCADLREDEFIPMWDVLGGPRSTHTRVPMAWMDERLAPLPVTQLSPGTWASPSEPWRTRCSARWPQLRADILHMATVETMEACGTSEGERRCAACGAGWPSEEIDLDEPYRVPNYVGPEHLGVMREEIRRESEYGHIFLASL
ncbi:hypothetical protein CYMTET_20135 [Cymbomonas tetramitiformis]|uniref:Uncharacterized protein n=1 Tax=Cymbomonas tetramitiformis TaxID=36881 RepID=A0AAE0G601_9CHLO|nr:hypothetical protein CYMTET_20135 [Cymbomonas tetramitiformis]